MYLQQIYEQTIYSQKTKYTRADFSLDDILVGDMPFKVSFVEKGSFELFGSYELSKSNFSADPDKFNEQSLSFSIPKGNYVLLYTGGGILSKSTGKVNDCIKTTATGEIKFDELTFASDEIASANDGNIASLIAAKSYRTLKYFTLKGSARSKIRFWVTGQDASDLVGKVSFAIYKITEGKTIAHEASSCYIGAAGGFTANIKKNVIYSMTVSKLMKDSQDEQPEKVVMKYPVGTYQITINDTLMKSSSAAVLTEAMNADKQNFSLSQDGKLINFRGISIPKDVDPANYYFMIGKVQLMLYIDFNNDDYYIYPNSYAECFMNLFIPKLTVEEIESTDDYAVYSITDFTLISNDYRSTSTIKSNILKWIDCNIKDIHEDEYGLFFWVENFNLHEWYIMKYKEIIESHFMTVHLYDIKASVFDDVDAGFEDPNHILDYNIDVCRWRIEDSPNAKYGFVEWTYGGNWQNTDVPNKIKISCTGSAYVKVSKKHFYNIVTENGAHSGDFEHNPDGNLTDAQFRKLNINGPDINPFQRFQYWLGFKL